MGSAVTRWMQKSPVSSSCLTSKMRDGNGRERGGRVMVLNFHISREGGYRCEPSSRNLREIKIWLWGLWSIPLFCNLFPGSLVKRRQSTKLSVVSVNIIFPLHPESCDITLNWLMTCKIYTIAMERLQIWRTRVVSSFKRSDLFPCLHVGLTYVCPQFTPTCGFTLFIF